MLSHLVFICCSCHHVAAGLVTECLIDSVLSSCRQTLAQWQGALKAVPGLKAIDSLQPEKSAVSEELNVAWARHELISDNVDEVRGSFTDSMTSLGPVLQSIGSHALHSMHPATGMCSLINSPAFRQFHGGEGCLPGVVLACAWCASCNPTLLLSVKPILSPDWAGQISLSAPKLRHSAEQ